MERWVALLRGVNVGGVKVSNTDLVEVFESLGFAHVKPVQAAGNVLFDAELADAAQGRRAIEAALAERYGRAVPALVYSRAQIAEMVAGYPFERADDTTHPYVLLVEPVTAIDQFIAAARESGSPDDAAPGALGVYWRCPRGESLTNPLALAFGNVRAPVITTNRNLRTLAKLAAS